MQKVQTTFERWGETFSELLNVEGIVISLVDAEAFIIFDGGQVTSSFNSSYQRDSSQKLDNSS